MHSSRRSPRSDSAVSSVNKFEERTDELISMASHAGMLGTEALQAETKAHGARDRRLTRRATEARKIATTAENLLANTRKRFLREFDK